MYNGVGLATPRGTGTSAYVQRNLGHLRPRDGPPGGFGSGPQDFANGQGLLGPPVHRQPDQGILDHERKRKVEIEVFKLREELEEKNTPEDDIISQTTALRSRLLTLSRPQDQLQGSHGIAAAKAREMDKMGRALGIAKGYKEGAAFSVKDQEAEKAERLAKREEADQRRADMLATRKKEQEEREAKQKEADKIRRREEYFARLAAEEARKNPPAPPPRAPSPPLPRSYDQRQRRRYTPSPSPPPRAASDRERYRSRSPQHGRNQARSISPPPRRQARSPSLPPRRQTRSPSPPPRVRTRSANRSANRSASPPLRRGPPPVGSRLRRDSIDSQSSIDSRSPPPPRNHRASPPPPSRSARGRSPSRSPQRPKRRMSDSDSDRSPSPPPKRSRDSPPRRKADSLSPSPPPKRRYSRSPPQKSNGGKRQSSYDSDSSFDSRDSHSPPPRKR